MGNVGFIARRRSCVRPQLCLMLGGAIAGALLVMGCADEGESVLGFGGRPAAGGAAATAGASSGSGGVATAGASSGSGGIATAGSPGSSGSTSTAGAAGTSTVGGDGNGGGSAGSVSGGGSGGTAGGGTGGSGDVDECPNDPALTKAGKCGCLPDSLGALCLAHRYQFDGTGTVVTDAIAGATGNGTVMGTTLSGTGTLVLAGGTSDEYVTLPPHLVSALGNSATIEAWITWAGTGGDWQRIFDFGSNDAGEGMQGDGQGYLFLTPRAVGEVMRVAISPLGNPEEDQVSADAALPTTLTHLAVVIDGEAKTLTLYQNGVSQGTPSTISDTTTLSGLSDLNNWLGRSQYQGDEELAGTYHELRIYSRALTSAQITANGTAGPDALP